MVAEASRETTTTTVTSFAPRQVVLLNRSMKQKGSPEAVENGAEVKARKSEKKRRKELHKMGPLLRSIAAFLDKKGLSATLSSLLSEASIEVDNWKTDSFNLEDMFSEFSIASKHLGTAITDDSKKQDSIKDETPREDNDEKDHERNRKGVVGEGRVTETKSSMSEEIHKPDLSNRSCDVEEVDTESKEEKKKKKKKKTSEPLGNEIERTAADTGDLQEDRLSDRSEKSKAKKKKHKSMDLEKVEQEPNREMLSSNRQNLDSELPKSTSNGIDLDATLKSKDKKRRKQKTESDAGTKKSDENGFDVKDKEHKKRKRSESEEQDSLSDSHFGIKDKPVNKTDEFDDMKAIKKLVPGSQSQLSNGNGNPSKKRKAEKGDEDRENSDDANIDNTPALQGEKKKPTVDCGVVKNGTAGLTPKALKKEDSAEPRTAKAFQRVKIDEVEFVDERLQDNSYWAKGGADAGYGAKAQEVLGQVRGRDFRHEKTKKKRGSYRGGQIDLQSHSIKFNYSDDE
ncbi:hypothetical protein H6P81_019581 [Aristolochia fimbriata]|uniref:Srp40 C-terminal domain-containing protein n=1 Tax=Aristolochia fimbriata TaxID=158543 RepID=A0AAV7DT91_ARIFI|nr:hypothetical protein H6P81_019581 [Aristolochia fimbriata]